MWTLKNERMLIFVKSMGVLIDSIKRKWFPDEEDIAWNNWVDSKKREQSDLIDLFKSDIGDGHKKRALFLLLVPSADMNPIYWKGEVGTFCNDVSYFIGLLNTDLKLYLADLLVNYIKIIRPIHCGRQNMISRSLGEGMELLMSLPSRYHKALFFYNKCILELLIVLPSECSEVGEKLLESYSLNDVSSYWNMDDASGYNPFCFLLLNEYIEEKWKRAADKKMQQIIKDEILGIKKPREEWENALISYISIIMDHLYGDLKYPLDLFVEQILFLMENRTGVHLINSWQVMKIFQILSDDVYIKLRHDIARYLLLEDDDEVLKFSVYDKNTQMTADYMLKEFTDDVELTKKVKELINDSKKIKI